MVKYFDILLLLDVINAAYLLMDLTYLINGWAVYSSKSIERILGKFWRDKPLVITN